MPQWSSPHLWPKSTLWLQQLWKFSRPHTIIGTSLSVLGLAAIALAVTGEVAFFSHQSPLLPMRAAIASLLFTWLACLGGNLYIVGLNQLEDVEIDRINKPGLPLAAGEFSQHQGRAIVATAGISALLLALTQGWFLLATVLSSLVIGTAYSLPPLRLKRFPFWAALCIFTVRGLIVNLGLFLHFQQRLGGAGGIPPVVWALTLFIVVFSVAIALVKDIPDTAGDRQFNISTFTLKLGTRRVLNLALGLLSSAYLGLVVAGFWLPLVQPEFLISTHLGILAALWWRSRRVDLQDHAAIARFYQFIWKLFFLEYLIFPAACLLRS